MVTLHLKIKNNAATYSWVGVDYREHVCVLTNIAYLKGSSTLLSTEGYEASFTLNDESRGIIEKIYKNIVYKGRCLGFNFLYLSPGLPCAAISFQCEQLVLGCPPLGLCSEGPSWGPQALGSWLMAGDQRCLDNREAWSYSDVHLSHT